MYLLSLSPPSQRFNQLIFPTKITWCTQIPKIAALAFYLIVYVAWMLNNRQKVQNSTAYNTRCRNRMVFVAFFLSSPEIALAHGGVVAAVITRDVVVLFTTCVHELNDGDGTSSVKTLSPPHTPTFTFLKYMCVSNVTIGCDTLADRIFGMPAGCT